MYITILPHAIKRAQERLGWSLPILRKVSFLARTEGTRLTDQKWLDKCAKHGPNNIAMSYAYTIFIFKEHRLITILPSDKSPVAHK